MKKYISFFKIRFLTGLQYRTAALAGIITQFIWGFMTILMFYAFYRENPEAFPMGFSQFSSYIWLRQSFLALFMMWGFDNEIFAMISDGNISYELTRPADLYNMWFAKNAAMRLSAAALKAFPILITAVFLPEPFKLVLPADLSVFLTFLFSLILGFLVVISFIMLLYISVFHTMSALGVRLVIAALSEFLSGAVIPLPFFPDGVRQFAEVLPFAAMENLPYRIYSGDISGAETVYGTMLQVFWLIVLMVSGKLWMGSSLKKIVVQGG